MANLLRSHNQIAFGRERYNSFFKRTNRLSTDLFEKKRFCQTLLAGDTHHTQLDKYYQDLLNRYEHCTFVGDKIPSLYRIYADLNREFPGCKIVFMLRDIFDVASSFEARRAHSLKNLQAPWPTTKGYREAVFDWNLSIDTTLSCQSASIIEIVDYEQLYKSDDVLENLFQFLGLECSDSVRAFWQDAKLKQQDIQRNRKNGLDQSQREYILEHANFEGYRTLSKIRT